MGRRRLALAKRSGGQYITVLGPGGTLVAYQGHGQGETMRIVHSPSAAGSADAGLQRHVMEHSGEPLPGGASPARIVAPSGKAETVRFTSSGDEWGGFGSFTPQNRAT